MTMGSRTGISWAKGGQIAISTRADQPGPHAPFATYDPFDYNITQILALRYQAHLIFTSDMSVPDKSRSYLVALQECIEALAEAEAAGMDQRVDIARGMVNEAHKVYSFCEALYFAGESSELEVPLLLIDWLLVHFSDLDDAVKQFRSSSNDGDFWMLLARLCAVGRRDVALELVQERIKSDPMAMGAAAFGDVDSSDPLHVAEAALFDSPDDSADARVDGTFRIWQENSIATAEALRVDDSDGQVGLLLWVIAGSGPAIQKACKSWEEIFVATMLYSRTDTSLPEVRGSAARLAAKYQPSHPSLAALADSNPMEAVVLLASSGDFFFAAHLADMLQSGSKRGKYDVQTTDGESVRDYLIMEYAASLGALRGTMRIAVDYLLTCGSRGEEVACQLLQHTEVQSAADTTVDKVLSLSKRLPPASYNLVSQRTCRKLAAASASLGNASGAVYWYTRGGDDDRAIAQSEICLGLAEEHGCNSAASESLDRAAEAISICGNSNLQSQFEYLRMYAELQSALLASTEDSDAAQEAASIAAMLVSSSGGLPEKHWAVLIYDCCSYLLPSADSNLKTSALSKDSTYALIGALETVAAAKGTHRELLLEALRTRNPSADPEEIIANTRLKLLKNLAMCVLTQHS